MEHKFNIKIREEDIFKSPTDDELQSIENELDSILDYIKIQF